MTFKRLFSCILAFAVGAVVTAAPFVISGHIDHLKERARGEPTMGPGLKTAMGLIVAPVGGVLASGAWLIWRYRRDDSHSSHSDI